jgi:hypothetical protein
MAANAGIQWTPQADVDTGSSAFADDDSRGKWRK